MDGQPPEQPFPTEDGATGIDRREALRRVALAAGVAWVVPAVQSVNVPRAYAFSPGNDCFSVRIDRNGGCHDAGKGRYHSFQCMRDSPNLSTLEGGCSLIAGVRRDPDGRWFVTLAPGVTFIEGYSRGGYECVPSPTPPGSTGTIEFDPPPVEPGPQLINEVQLTICQPATNTR